MKPDIRLTKLAQLLVQYSVEIKTDDKVNIYGTTFSELLLKEIYKEVMRVGAHPRVLMQFEDQEYIFYSLANDAQLNYPDPFYQYEIERVEALISVFPDFNPHALTSIDPEKKRRKIIARSKITETLFKRWGTNELRWVGTLCPSSALAQEARMSLVEYAEFVFSCMNLNDDDPVGYWRSFSLKQQKVEVSR